MIFIDGLGMGHKGEENPYFFARTPFLDSLLGGHIMYKEQGRIVKDNAALIPTDASLEMPGEPQSATGQTTLWTGVNAARAVGRHVKAFPTRELREIIAEHSIMRKLAAAGKRVTSANAYRDEFFDKTKPGVIRYSTSTLTILSSGTPFRNFDDLRKGNAVYQDFTNQLVIEMGYKATVISPEEAGQNLARIAAGYDFTLYEYFQTDKAGHKVDMPRAIKIFEQLDRFIGSCANNTNLDEVLMIITSDHGNMEDLSISTHTLNPVPTLIIYNRLKEIAWERIISLTDITPFILDLLGVDGGK
jgi:2,3-bisphosphoglycerate-independent phosphoglycerate mutase